MKSIKILDNMWDNKKIQMHNYNELWGTCILLYLNIFYTLCLAHYFML